VIPNGLPTTAHFEYGLDPKYSGGGPIVYNLHTPSHGVGSDFSSHPVSATVQGLVPNAVYHVRLVASNSAGQTVGPDQTFKTKKDREPGPPVLGKTFDASVVHGLVLIKFPPGKGPHAAFKKGQGFIPLTEPRQLPVGTEVDSRRGTLNVTTATVKIGKHKAKPQTGTVSGAIFKVSQSRAKLQKGLTTLRIIENAFRGAPSTSKCTVKGAADTGAHAARLSRRTLQTLHYRGHGHFSVRGRYSVGVELGTVFNTTDRCDATLTVVKRGAVKVTDLIRHKTIIVHAGHSYLARALRAKKHG
jgi:hypothetical protein